MWVTIGPQRILDPPPDRETLDDHFLKKADFQEHLFHGPQAMSARTRSPCVDPEACFASASRPWTNQCVQQQPEQWASTVHQQTMIQGCVVEAPTCGSSTSASLVHRSLALPTHSQRLQSVMPLDYPSAPGPRGPLLQSLGPWTPGSTLAAPGPLVPWTHPLSPWTCPRRP